MRRKCSATHIPDLRLSTALPDNSLIAGEVPAWVWTRCRDIWDRLTEIHWKFTAPNGSTKKTWLCLFQM